MEDEGIVVKKENDDIKNKGFIIIMIIWTRVLDSGLSVEGLWSLYRNFLFLYEHNRYLDGTIS